MITPARKLWEVRRREEAGEPRGAGPREEVEEALVERAADAGVGPGPDDPDPLDLLAH